MTLTSYLEIVEFLKKRIQEKDQQIAEFSIAEPYKDAVRYLRAFRGIETQAAMTFTMVHRLKFPGPGFGAEFEVGR